MVKRKRKALPYRLNPSIKWKELYAKLRKKGYSKTKSAKISNAKAKTRYLKKAANKISGRRRKGGGT